MLFAHYEKILYIYIYSFSVCKEKYIIAEVHEAKINEGTKEDVLDLGER